MTVEQSRGYLQLYIQMHSIYKRNVQPDSVGFLHSSWYFFITSNEELAKTVESLIASMKSMQDKIMVLTGRATHSGVSPQSGSGSLQNRSTDSAAGYKSPKQLHSLEELLNKKLDKSKAKGKWYSGFTMDKVCS